MLKSGVWRRKGIAIADAVRQIGVTQQTYYRWRKQYGGMNRDQLKRLASERNSFTSGDLA
jgi:transposase-like protein